jgi:hypothetical protein
MVAGTASEVVQVRVDGRPREAQVFKATMDMQGRQQNRMEK